MKFTTKLFLTWTSIFLIFYVAVISVLGLLWGIRIQFWQLALAFFIAGVLPPAILTWFFFKRLDYMESEDLTPPKFSGSRKITMSFKSRSANHFDEILQRIDRGFIISFSDREKQVVKFRTDTRVLAWGIGGYVKMLNDNQIEVIVYPMIADSRREEKILLQSIRLLHALLNP